jgi:L-fuconolactonase
MMIIDSHLHVWKLARGDYDWLTAELSPLYADHALTDILPLFDQNRVSKCILVQAAPSIAETQYLFKQAKLHSNHVVAVVGWIDFSSKHALKQLDELCLEPLLRGLRPMLQDISPDNWILQERFTPIFQALINKGLVFDALVKQQQLPVIYELACRFPKLNIVIDHCGKPDVDKTPNTQWQKDLAKLAQCPKVTIKICGLPAQFAPAFDEKSALHYITEVFALFGADRVMWGSDWPVVKLASDYLSWLSFCQRCCRLLNLSQPQQTSLFYQTAIDVYGLSVYPESQN